MLDWEGLWLPGCSNEYLCPCVINTPINDCAWGMCWFVWVSSWYCNLQDTAGPSMLAQELHVGVLICWIVMGGIGGGGGGGEGWWGVPALISHPISLLRPSLHSPPGCNASAHRPAANNKGSALQIQLQHKQKILMQRKIVWLEGLFFIPIWICPEIILIS